MTTQETIERLIEVLGENFTPLGDSEFDDLLVKVYDLGYNDGFESAKEHFENWKEEVGIYG